MDPIQPGCCATSRRSGAARGSPRLSAAIPSAASCPVAGPLRSAASKSPRPHPTKSHTHFLLPCLKYRHSTQALTGPSRYEQILLGSRRPDLRYGKILLPRPVPGKLRDYTLLQTLAEQGPLVGIAEQTPQRKFKSAVIICLDQYSDHCGIDNLRN